MAPVWRERRKSRTSSGIRLPRNHLARDGQRILDEAHMQTM